MKKISSLAQTAIIIVVTSCSQSAPDNLVLLKGGSFINTKSNYYQKNVTISAFYIGRYEVTQKEWIEVMGSNPSKFTVINYL